MYEYFMKHIAGNKPRRAIKKDSTAKAAADSLADSYAINLLGLLGSGNQF